MSLKPLFHKYIIFQPLLVDLCVPWHKSLHYPCLMTLPTFFLLSTRNMFLCRIYQKTQRGSCRRIKALKLLWICPKVVIFIMSIKMKTIPCKIKSYQTKSSFKRLQFLIWKLECLGLFCIWTYQHNILQNGITERTYSYILYLNIKNCC